MIAKPKPDGRAAMRPVPDGVHAMCTASRRVERQRRSEAVFDSPGTVPGVQPDSSAALYFRRSEAMFTD
jgi:hypothetical protein